ncbi:ribonuclease H-like domain-containing protein [Biscogniauxia mediterranea]|nr:ribonuclease H-like domain-containing protein [Biscogniauxia mediterranea]
MMMSLYGTGAPPLDEFSDDEIKRRFDPRASARHCDVPESELVVYNAQKQVSQLQVRNPRTLAVEPDPRTVVLAIDGACRGNGTPAARGAWGVHFGPGSPLNARGLLDPALPQTNSRAEIEALAQAVRIVRERLCRGRGRGRDDPDMRHFRIRSDSGYLVQAMSEWIGDWNEARGRNSRGRPVAHYGALKEIHDQLDEMSSCGGGDGGEGRDFKFWYVPRDQNREADALANQSLDAASVPCLGPVDDLRSL